MKKKCIIIISMVVVGFLSKAQVVEIEKDLKEKPQIEGEGWITGGMLGMNFSQTSLTNWTAGGQNTIATNGVLNLYADYKKNKLAWDNNLDLAYGIVRQGGKQALWQKTDDRIALVSKMGYDLKNNMYVAILYQFRTQFTPGYSDITQASLISDFLAPAYSIFAVGMDYKPNNVWTAFVAPVTLKTTVVMNQNLANMGAYGVTGAEYDDLGNLVTKGKNIRNEFGGYIRFKYQKDIITNINLQTNIDLFSNYLHNPQNIDINWQVLLAMRVNKYITATLTTHLIYDDDIDIAVDTDNDGVMDKSGPRTQFKEVFGIGFLYKFPESKDQ